MKIIETAPVWECENMDLLAPINREGTLVLFDNDSRKVVWSDESCPTNEWANDEEVASYRRKRGFLAPKDRVVIIKGRKLPIGAEKIIESFYTYDVKGTYGHQFTDYIVFEDGTKTNIQNVRPIEGCFDDVEYMLKFKGSFLSGGRI